MDSLLMSLQEEHYGDTGPTHGSQTQNIKEGKQECTEWAYEWTGPFDRTQSKIPFCNVSSTPWVSHFHWHDNIYQEMKNPTEAAGGLNELRSSQFEFCPRGIVKTNSNSLEATQKAGGAERNLWVKKTTLWSRATLWVKKTILHIASPRKLSKQKAASVWGIPLEKRIRKLAKAKWLRIRSVRLWVCLVNKANK